MNGIITTDEAVRDDRNDILGRAAANVPMITAKERNAVLVGDGLESFRRRYVEIDLRMLQNAGRVKKELRCCLMASRFL